MTTTLRASVRRVPRVGGDPMGEHWMVLAYTIAEGRESDPHDTFEITFTDTHANAMQLAHQGIKSLERMLTDEVHASRASRRETSIDVHTVEATA